MNRPVHASYLLSGATPERAFAALLDVRRLPEWLNTIAHRPFFRGLTEQLLRRSMRRLGERLREAL